MIKVEKNIAGRPLKIESGQIARQAGGSYLLRTEKLQFLQQYVVHLNQEKV